MRRPLTQPCLALYISKMKSACTAGRRMRIVIAITFGFMSLGHGPIMTFAHAAKNDSATMVASHHHGAATQAGHAHDMTDADCHEPAVDQPSACNAFGCFITVGAADIEPPPQAMTPIGKLMPPPLPATLPVLAEPADPPPRLHG